MSVDEIEFEIAKDTEHYAIIVFVWKFAITCEILERLHDLGYKYIEERQYLGADDYVRSILVEKLGKEVF